MNQEEQQHLSDLNHKIEKIFRDISHRTHHSELYDNRIQSPFLIKQFKARVASFSVAKYV
jgi:hypothetical protein